MIVGLVLALTLAPIAGGSGAVAPATPDSSDRSLARALDAVGDARAASTEYLRLAWRERAAGDSARANACLLEAVACLYRAERYADCVRLATSEEFGRCGVEETLIVAKSQIHLGRYSTASRILEMVRQSHLSVDSLADAASYLLGVSALTSGDE